MPAITYAPDVRKARLQLARQTRQAVAELNTLLLDPDLSQEAKQRRAAPLREKIRAITDKAQKDTAAIVAAARAAADALHPSALRRVEAFKHPERAVAIRALLSDASRAELAAFAKLATATRDVAAAYAIASVLDDRIATMPEGECATIRKELDQPAAIDAGVAKADWIVARAESLRMGTDADRLIHGRNPDALAWMQSANAELTPESVVGVVESITPADLEAMYNTTGVPLAPPAELLTLIDGAATIFRKMDAAA